MAIVGAVTGSAGKDFESLTEQAKELGRTTSFTATQVAEGMTALGRAGFDAAQIMQAIPEVLALSRATATDLGEAAEIAAAALRGFGLEASETQRVTDVLTATANNSAQTLTDIGESLKFVAPLAKEAGATLEDTAESLGILANNGIKGTVAGTALARAYKNLSTTSAQKALRKINVEAVDGLKNLRPLASILRELGVATKDLGSAERLAIFEQLFGRGQAAALKLAQPAGEFKKLSEAIRNADGIAQRTAATMENTLGGSFRRLLSAAEGVAIAIGDSLDMTLRGYMQTLTAAASAVTGFVKQNQGLVIGIAKAAIALTVAGVALVGVGVAIKTVGATIAVINTLRTSMIALGVAADTAAIKMLVASTSFNLSASAGTATTFVAALAARLKTLGAIAITFQGISLAGTFVAIKTAVIAAAGSLGAFAVAAGSALLAVAPFVIAIAALGFAAFKAFKFFEDRAALEETRKEIEKLTEQTKRANQELLKLDKATGTGTASTIKQTRKETEEWVKSLVKAGKTQKEILAILEKSRKKQQQIADTVRPTGSGSIDPNAFSKEVFAGRRKEARLTAQALQEVIDDELKSFQDFAGKVREENQKTTRSFARQEEERLKKSKSTIDQQRRALASFVDFQHDLQTSREIQSEESAFEETLGIDPGKALEDASKLYADALSSASDRVDEAQQALLRSIQNPSASNTIAATNTADTARDAEGEVDRRARLLKRATEAVTRSKEESIRAIDDFAGRLEVIQDRRAEKAERKSFGDLLESDPNKAFKDASDRLAETQLDAARETEEARLALTTAPQYTTIFI